MSGEDVNNFHYLRGPLSRSYQIKRYAKINKETDEDTFTLKTLSDSGLNVIYIHEDDLVSINLENYFDKK